jgi:short subunit dehydrogenase-like uncharacterized protein
MRSGSIMGKIILYGSYGYTGNLIAEIASLSNYRLVLSGRDSGKLKKQSELLKLPFLPASLDSPSELDELLKDAELVLHCAGPFIQTWKPMAEACIRNGCHYLDITGEISVFESLKNLDHQFKERGIMAMPGVGFDVVPTDCMAAWLYEQMPDASQLELAFQGLGGGVSRGTAKTMIENLGKGGAIRENGVIKKVPAAYKTKKIKLGEKEVSFVSIPWGDISTAHFTTGIDNITVYTAMSEKMIQRMKWMNRFSFLLKLDLIKRILKNRVEKRKPGPGKETRESAKSIIWGQVINNNGEIKTGLIETKEGYQLTSEIAWNIAIKVLDGKWEKGYQTPSKVYGADLILEIAGSKRRRI